MMMQSKAFLCWRELGQACRDERCIRMRLRAGVISGNVITACPMRSKAFLCWRGSVKAITCEQAFERDRVPSHLRQRTCGMSAHRSSGPAAQPARVADAAARPRDPSFFEGQNRLERDLDLLVAAQLMGKPLGGKPSRTLITMNAVITSSL